MGTQDYRSNATHLAFLFAALAASSPGPAAAQTQRGATQTDERIRFDIDAQPLGAAVTEYARQSRSQVLFSWEELAELRSTPLHGQYDRTQALELLLQGSGVRAHMDNDAIRLEAPPGPQYAEDDGPPEESGEEIIVTGTRIRGAAPVGSELVTLNRGDIAERGRATTEELMRTLPQVFGGDIGQHVSFQGGNIGGGSAVNLRGLGADATLSLINGRRLPTIGLRGNFADISTIPVSAIERVEVLPDSASAIYGSDAVGGVVNFVMRRDFEGLEAGVRYGGVTEGDLRETRMHLAAGGKFGPLSLFGAYERYDRTALAMADRPYLADSDLRALGGNNFDLTRSNPTTLIVSGLGSFAVPFGQDGTDLEQNDLLAGQLNLANSNEGLDALPEQTQDAIFLSAGLDITTDLELFAEARFARRTFFAQNGHVSQRITIPATNAFRAVHNLFPGRTVQADYDFFRDLGPRAETGELTTLDLYAGARLDVGDTWSIEPSLTYARFGGDHRIDNLINTTALTSALASGNPATAFNPLGDGSFTSSATLESIRGWTLNDIVSEVWSAGVKADGELFDLPGGPLRVAFGGDYRQEFYQIGGLTFVTGTAPVPRVSTENGRNVTAVYGEVLAPVFGSGFASWAGEGLDLSLAARFERYSDFGDTLNPKIGLQWSLTEAFSLRASYGHSFRAPNLVDLDPDGSINRRQVRGIPITDPVSPTGVSQIIFIAGANPDLHEQTAVSWSAGFVYDPPEADGFRLEAGYFNVEFSDRISAITNIAAAMFPNSEFASLVDRSPDPAFVAALLAEATLLGTSGGFSVADIDAVVDVRATNLARTDVRGFDAAISYSMPLAGGELELNADATYILEFLRAASPIAAPRDVAGTVGNPLNLRARFGAAWRNDDVSAGLTLNWSGAYRDNLSAPQRDIDGWATVDLHLGAALPETAVGGRPRLALTVSNLFDEDPPFVNNALGFGYDPANADPLGRFIALELSTRF